MRLYDKRLCAVSFALLLGALDARPHEATALIQNDFENQHDYPAIYGVWLSHHPTGTLSRIYERRVRFADISPDGRQVLVVVRDSLYVMNNDGSEIRGVLGGGGFGDKACPLWTTRGIFWLSGNRIHRLDPSSGEQATVLDLARYGPACSSDRSFYYGSRDGLRVWTRSDYEAPGIDSIYCGCRGYSRGGHAYIQFSSDFTSHTALWRSEWGHGNGMTADGHLFLVQLGGHRTLGITRQNGHNLTTLYDYYEYDPPIPTGMESRPVPVSVNNDSIVGSRASYTDNPPGAICSDDLGDCPPGVHYYYWNWRTRELLGEFRQPDSLNGNAVSSYYFWYGPLPNPHDDSPYLAVDTREMVFVADGDTAPAPQLVSISNTGGAPLTGITVTTSPAQSDWLQVAAGGSGDAQFVSITVVPDAMPSDQTEASVMISGGGAPNHVSFVVKAYRGVAVAAPTQLTAAAAGDSLLDAALRWRDNSTNESGFVVEYRREDGNWAEAGRVGAGDTSFTVAGLDYHRTYHFRVLAFRVIDDDTDVYSGPSPEVTLHVTGISWIRISSPAAGQAYHRGRVIPISWTENMVSQVQIELSLDNGESWELVTREGGISKGDQYWRDLPWTVPDTAVDSAIIKVKEYFDGSVAYSGAFAIVANAAARNHVERHGVGAGLLLRATRSGALVLCVSKGPFELCVVRLDGTLVWKARGVGPLYRAIAPGACADGIVFVNGTVGGARVSRSIMTLEGR